MIKPESQVSDGKPIGVWHTYNSSRGLKISAYKLLQDRAGYLWIGAHPPGGLCRYDGVEFSYFSLQDGLLGLQLECLFEDSRGRLWVCTNDPDRPAGLVEFKSGKFEPILEPGLPTRIRAMTEDASGVLWFYAVDSNLYSFDGESVVQHQHPDGRNVGPRGCITCDSKNRIWMGGEDLLCYQNGTFTQFQASDGMELRTVRAITEDTDGNIVIGGTGGLQIFDGDEMPSSFGELLFKDADVTAILLDQNGRLWIGGSEGGVKCISPTEVHAITRSDGIYDEIVHDIICDREGSVWFAHASGGLSRFEPDAVEILSRDSIPHYALSQDEKGGTWYASQNDILHHSDSQTQRLRTSGHIEDLLVDKSGGLWCLGTPLGILHFESSEDAFSTDPQHIEHDENGKLINPMCITCTSEGAIVVGGYAGLFHWNGAAFRRIAMVPNSIFHICCDRMGVYWMARWRLPGLIRFDGKDASSYHQSDGLPSDYIRWIREGDDGRLWIGTIGGGVSCISAKDIDNMATAPRFDTMPFNDEFKSIWITRLFQDDVGRWWISTLTGGVYCYDGTNIQVIGSEDGLPSSNVVGVVQESEDVLLIATQNGLVRYRVQEKPPSPVSVLEVIADRVYLEPKKIELTTLTAALVRFRFRGISYRTHRIRYTYRLEGFDAHWLSGWEEEAIYENLPEGTYTFSVKAIDRDLKSSRDPSSLFLTVKPDPRDEQIAVLQSEIDELRSEVGGKYDFDQIIGTSVPMKQLFGMMEKAIDAGLTVLIAGETGTGKELVAKAIHNHSNRRDKQMQELNCGAVPKDLFAATLFGYKKGSFTGAYEDRPGLFESADGGTILLDEIGELSADAQVHMLRVLQEQTIQRVGETQARSVDVRVIA
ncbi:MAG: sigma 54-interacting transcriptional regulator, partial [Candidatus Latescibacteria bacterium]|nr:sigma 54-interacting transcriptional regulator [Candidatus Latescibacterota bacterium]